MHKISNFTGQAARHGLNMGFGMSRPHQDPNMSNPPGKRAMAAAPLSPAPTPGAIVNLSFNVPFASNLPGPDVEDIIHASPGAFARWTHPEGSPEAVPNHKLPIHASNLESLRTLCRQISDASDGRVTATVTSSEPKPIPGLQRGPLKALVTNVCVSGDADTAAKMRERILNETPISLRSTIVDVDNNLIIDPDTQMVKKMVLDHLDVIAQNTKADIFILYSKPIDIESASFNGTLDTHVENRFRLAIFGDAESAEHAKTRILIMIDQILGRQVDVLRCELTLHSIICGRARKNIKMIESATSTAIYFPPPFPNLYGFTPAGATRRRDDEILITGQTQDNILQAKKRIHDLVMGTKTYVKDVMITSNKLDDIILERLDKVRKIIEFNGSHVLLPKLGMQRGIIRIQGTDILNVERTARDLMALAGHFYSASWWITQPDPSQRLPNPSDIRAMLSDICINSGAEISFEKLTFHINGSDDAVKAAMMVIDGIPFIKKSQYNMRVNIELANEHKEFVSGKKNGKINKIMSQASVQIMFDGFNEYNFYINVRASQYDAIKMGLELVEQEMPASISFHVPDQYHKRIIGIGGQHIQRIMKKYSVFVKFSNAMDRGNMGKEDDDIKVDNVICRTPSRNAQNLDLVKQEIMDMVEKVDAEFTSEKISVDRLYHRELLARLPEIEDLEKKWNCKIVFPSTEEASDSILVTGPEYQVPQAVDEFLGMVPDVHQVQFPGTSENHDFIRSAEFNTDVAEKLRSQYEVDPVVQEVTTESFEGKDIAVETIDLRFTRNNQGGLKDAIDFLITRLVAHGVDSSVIKGLIPRPKSDSFEDTLPYFNSKLHIKSADMPATESPTRPEFATEAPAPDQRSFLDKLRKPGSISSFSSFLERRKNGSSSPGSLFKHASSNASKASLASLESQGSFSRHPWNDSGVNLPDEEPGHSAHNSFSFTQNGSMPFPGMSITTSAPPVSSMGMPSSAATVTAAQLGGPGEAGGSGFPGDATPKYDRRQSFDSGRPSTSNSTASGYPSAAPSVGGPSQ